MKLLAVLAVFLCMGAPSQGYGCKTAANYVNSTNFHSRIVGGWQANEGQFPYQGYINTYPCGAVLIKRNWALTAAHCVRKHHNIKICFGSRFSDNFPVRRVVREKVIHPNHDPQLAHNDVALLRFDPVPFGPNVQPIRIDRTRDDHVNWEALVSGFGQTVAGGSLPGHLRYTQLRVITNYDCKKIYGIVVIDSTICADPSSSNKGIADGDTGGPLVIRGPEPENGALLIGIASFWHKDGPDIGKPSGFARINRFASWIDLITGS